MQERRIPAEVFEIDRLKAQQRMEYLNCFKKMFNCDELPMIFMRDQFVGGFAGLQSYLSNMDEKAKLIQ